MTVFITARRQYQPRGPARLVEVEKSTFTPAPVAAAADAAAGTTIPHDLFPFTGGQPLLHLSGGQGDHASRKKPIRVGCVFSGGQAPGGHNVVAGIFEGIRRLSPSSSLTGFLGGPSGILKNQTIEITGELIEAYRNTGGFDLLGTGRTKLESDEDFATCARVFARHELDAFIIIGGDDSNTNAAFLAEYLRKSGSPTCVIGVPKTIDSDLRGPWTETSFGFDTAVRVYSELIANIAKDALSGRKYYHFIRLMGRSASHITLEAALQTHPNIALISEEIARDGKSLRDIIDELAGVIAARAATGLTHGVVLVPEGLIEFVPEMRALIDDLNEVIAAHRDYMDSLRGFTAQIEYLGGRLRRESAATLASMPVDIQRQLIMDRDPHGNVALSRIETEKLLIELLAIRLGEMKSEGQYHGKFAWQTHFLGYEGRCAAPTNFDANYAWCLGLTASALAAEGHSGYLATVHGLTGPVEQWKAVGVPLVSMLTIERRKGKDKAVIKKTLVDTDGKAFQRFAKERDAWASRDDYRFTGPIQYFGPPDLVDRVPVSLFVNNSGTVE